MIHEARILHLTIAIPCEQAYAFACIPENFSLWAAGLATSLRRAADGWIADTPEGEAAVRFSEPNGHGVLDHWVRLPGQPEISIPLRMVANGDGTEVELVLFRQPEMDDARVEYDIALVKSDLKALKSLLENRLT